MLSASPSSDVAYRYYAVSGKECLVHAGEGSLTKGDFAALAPLASDVFYEPSNALAVCGFTEWPASLPATLAAVSIRSQFASLSAADTGSLARAKALASWRSLTCFCPSCGTRLTDHTTLTARLCPHCGRVIFPRIEPCIIVVIRRDDGRILLARHVQHNQTIYACIAGFMEAGETAEEAVRREVLEETGLSIDHITYFGSQSWPFPSQLMLGFLAHYHSGELHLQADEINEARWFAPDECPASPPPGSIAYRLIQAAYHGVK